MQSTLLAHWVPIVLAQTPLHRPQTDLDNCLHRLCRPLVETHTFSLCQSLSIQSCAIPSPRHQQRYHWGQQHIPLQDLSDYKWVTESDCFGRVFWWELGLHSEADRQYKQNYFFGPFNSFLAICWMAFGLKVIWLIAYSTRYLLVVSILRKTLLLIYWVICLMVFWLSDHKLRQHIIVLYVRNVKLEAIEQIDCQFTTIQVL